MYHVNSSSITCKLQSFRFDIMCCGIMAHTSKYMAAIWPFVKIVRLNHTGVNQLNIFDTK